MSKAIDSLLKPFQRFGINLGLRRIKQLLKDLGNPQEQVPIIHVAGTNGKGSVCAYLSAVLTEAGYQVGRYTSPHLVSWTERIALNEQPISEKALIEILETVTTTALKIEQTPTQFEIITAAAWLYFAQAKVDLAIMEVGLGGRLDATNVCDRPLASIIVSLSKEHWQRLGPTLADIAGEKAGVLKADCSAIISNSLPTEALDVVRNKVADLNCKTVWVEPAIEIPSAEISADNFQAINVPRWAKYQDLEYPLPLLGEMQLNNSAIAIATLEVLIQNGWQIDPQSIVIGMAKARWSGRLQWFNWKNRQLLIDGAHNPAAAKFLRQYVDSLDSPIIWLMGMLSTKDHQDIFQALLRPQDQLYLVPVSGHSTAQPEELAELAITVCPDLASCETKPDLFEALEQIYQENSDQESRDQTKNNNTVVFCGSLYLIGYFFQQIQASKRKLDAT